MSAKEASQDLEQIFTYVRTLYGPYEYKERRFGYSIARLENQARAMLASAPGDDGFYATANWFLTRFNDGHVSLATSANSNPVLSYIIGIILQPVQSKALVAEVIDPSLLDEGVSYGDEVVAVDGLSPFAQLDEYLKINAIGNELTNQHLILRALIRPGFAERIRPQAPTAHVQFRRADGTEFSRDLIWREDREERVNFVLPRGALPALDKQSFLARNALELNAHAQGSLTTLGATLPFFYTPATAEAFDITPVVPNAQMAAKYGLDPAAFPDIFSALYSYDGKSLLLIRQSGYGFDDSAARLQYYRAILDQYDGFADALVVDQTHNPGGSIDYCIDFARLFMTAPGQNFVQGYNTDRTWINAFREFARQLDPALSTELSQRYELNATLVEAAYNAGKSISDPMPLYLTKDLPPDDTYVWTKPKLVLIDELAGSCGDVFPMLIKRNGTAPLFGRRTMGLGGNVEAFGPLTNSAATLSLTRGLFTTHQDDDSYAPEDFVENNGVQPDIEHVITVDDFRTGFVDYMEHFSKEIVSQIDRPAPAPEGTPPAAPPDPPMASSASHHGE